MKVSNKPSRMSELKDVLLGIIESGKVSTKSLASVFGRALFVESQFMGKAGKLALAELRSMEKTNKRIVTLSEVQSEAMHNLLERYEKGVPRSLKMERTQLPCVVFTDGACEHGSDDRIICAVGGVIFDPAGEGMVEAFGSHVPDSVMESWKNASKVSPGCSDRNVCRVRGQTFVASSHRRKKVPFLYR